MGYECIEPGCTKHPKDGWAIYRTSPKGEDFEGKCEEHFEDEIEPIAKWIEERNHNK